MKWFNIQLENKNKDTEYLNLNYYFENIWQQIIIYAFVNTNVQMLQYFNMFAAINL